MGKEHVASLISSEFLEWFVILNLWLSEEKYGEYMGLYTCRVYYLDEIVMVLVFRLVRGRF